MNTRNFYDDLTSRAWGGMPGFEEWLIKVVADHGALLASNLAEALLPYSKSKTVSVGSTNTSATGLSLKLATEHNVEVRPAQGTRDLGLDAAGTRRLGVSMAVAAAGAAYPSVDQLADSFAHHAQAMQESLRSTAGLPPSTPDAADLGLAEEQGAVVGMIDDVVEDAFKSVCVFSHYTMGALLGGTMRRVLASWLAGVDGSSIGARCAPTAGPLASTLVIVGTPAGRYYKCDEYGDRLGDLVQQTMLDWTAAAG